MFVRDMINGLPIAYRIRLSGGHWPIEYYVPVGMILIEYLQGLRMGAGECRRPCFG